MISPGGLSLQKGAVVQKKWSSTQENMTLSWWKTCPDLLWTEWDWKWQFAPWLSSTPQIVTKSTSKCNSTEEHSFPPIPNHFVEYFEDSCPKTLLFFIFLSFFAIIVGHLLMTEKSIFVKGEFMNPKWSQCHWSCVCVCMKRMRALSSD